MSSNPSVPVRHDEAASRFVAEVEGLVAHADYELDGCRMVFTHTFVPAELRGRGLAEHLVRAALAHARARGLRIVPACSYVAAFVARHSEFADLAD